MKLGRRAARIRTSVGARLRPEILGGMCSNPTSYYSGIDATVLGSAGLKTALHNLIDAHTVVSYTPGAWDAITALDADPANAGYVIGIYSDHNHHATVNRGTMAGWNREHSWPKSYGIDYDPEWLAILKANNRNISFSPDQRKPIISKYTEDTLEWVREELRSRLQARKVLIGCNVIL